MGGFGVDIVIALSAFDKNGAEQGSAGKIVLFMKWISGYQQHIKSMKLNGGCSLELTRRMGRILVAFDGRTE